MDFKRAQELDLRRQEQIKNQVQVINRLLGIIQKAIEATHLAHGDGEMSDNAREKILTILAGVESEDTMGPATGYGNSGNPEARKRQVEDISSLW